MMPTSSSDSSMVLISGEEDIGPVRLFVLLLLFLMESGVVSIKQNGKVVDRSGGKRFGKGRKWER